MSFLICLFLGIFVNAFLSPRSDTMWLKVSVVTKLLSFLPPTVWHKIFVGIQILYSSPWAWFVFYAIMAWGLAFAPDNANSASAIAVSEPMTKQADEDATVRLFQENKPSVVRIIQLVAMWDAFTHAVVEVPQPSGSGFVWDEEGHIVTNYHVIDGASKVWVTLADQTTYDAHVVGFDRQRDVAVLHVDAPKNKLIPIRVGVSANLHVGQKVYAIGHPWGLDYSFTAGVISAFRTDISPATGLPIRLVIQTDAALNPGNSGGPLFDSSGSLIGMNTYGYTPCGASCGLEFAIAVDTVSRIVEQLVEFGVVTRPILGIRLPDQAVEQIGGRAVLLSDAPTNGSAGKADLQPTKLVVDERIGRKVTRGRGLYRILDQCKVGEKVDKTIKWTLAPGTIE